MKFAILKNDFDDGYIHWAESCEKNNIEYEIVDLVCAGWLEKILHGKYDCLLTCPPGREEHFKILYDERSNILENVLGYFLYPNFKEISIHENKKYLSYWLKANEIPHPKTLVFYWKNEAKDFATNCELPVVGKMNIGASGKGVTIFRDRKKLNEYIDQAFSEGLRQAWGPNLQMGNYFDRIKRIIKNPGKIVNRLAVYKKNYSAIQKNFVILQEHIEHEYEWRVVKIGDSYFGHQKVKQGDKASGTKGINYLPPPDDLLFFVRYLCERFGFNSMAVDLFEDGRGGYLVNELQCIFGHVQEYICEKDGQPGRFVLKNQQWVFEQGLFNNNLSYDLRMENVLSIISDKYHS